MKRLPFLFVALFAVWVAALPSNTNAAPATWSLQRASVGLDVSAAQFTAQGQSVSACLPGAYFSYSATSGLSLAATVERDFARHTTIGTAGGRFVVLRTDRGRVGVGEDLVAYGDNVAPYGITKPVSARSIVAGAFDVAQSKGRTTLWGIAQASIDAANDVKEIKVGLRWQAVGGSIIP